MRSERFIIARERNAVRVDFRREPDPPSPKFPGAAALRELVPPSDNPVSIHANQTEVAWLSDMVPSTRRQTSASSVEKGAAARW